MLNSVPDFISLVSIKLLITWYVLVLVQDTTEIRSGLYSVSLILMEKLLTYLSFLVIGESSEKAGNPLLV